MTCPKCGGLEDDYTFCHSCDAAIIASLAAPPLAWTREKPSELATYDGLRFWVIDAWGEMHWVSAIGGKLHRDDGLSLEVVNVAWWYGPVEVVVPQRPAPPKELGT